VVEGGLDSGVERVGCVYCMTDLSRGKHARCTKEACISSRAYFLYFPAQILLERYVLLLNQQGFKRLFFQASTVKLL
jgi:hypothetical protein